MNTEQKARMVLLDAILFFGLASILTFIYFQKFTFIAIIGFCLSFLCLLMIEMYLRIQHNIDQIHSSSFALNEKAAHKNELLQNNLFKFQQENSVFKNDITIFLEKVIDKLESENHEVNGHLEGMLSKLEQDRDLGADNKEIMAAINKVLENTVSKNFLNDNTEIILNFIINMQQKSDRSIKKLEEKINEKNIRAEG